MGRNYAIWFFAVLLVLMWGVTRVELVKGPRFQIIEPNPGVGDGPHYFGMVLTLLKGRLEMRQTYQGSALDHHTIVVNRKTGRAADWSIERPGPDDYEVSSHPIAYPALLAGIIWAFDRPPEDNLWDISRIMIAIGWLGAVVTYLCARRVAWTRGQALGAAAVLALASPWLAYTKSMFAETTGGLALILALWAFLSKRPLLAVFLASLATAVSPRLIVAPVGLIAGQVSAQEWKLSIKMSALFVFLLAGLFGWNYWLARMWILPTLTREARSYPTMWNALYETLLGPKYGLFRFIPWGVFAIPGLIYGRESLDGTGDNRSSSGDCDLACGDRFKPEWGLLIAVTLNALVLAWTRHPPSTCYGPRYWVAFMPWLSIGLIGATIRWPQTRYAVVILACLGAVVAIPDALQYRQLYEWPATMAWASGW